MKYFSLYDSKTQLYGQIFPAITFGAAERSVREAVNNPETQIAKYPEDFSLYHVLDFNDESGQVDSFTPALICQASALLSTQS